MELILEHCPIFIGLTIDKIEELLNSVSHRIKSYSKNDLIVMANDPVANLMIVLKGRVTGEMVDFTGKTIKIEDIEAPRPLAPAFLFGANSRYPVNIVADVETDILVIPKPSFIKLLQLNEIILSNFLNNVSNRAQFLSNKIKFLSFQSIKGKVAMFLLEIMKKSNSDVIVLPKSQSEMAELFGVTRPSLGRAIREMDNDGIIEATGKNIRIINKERLSQLLK